MVSKKAFSSEAAPKIILLDQKKAKNDGAQHLKMDQKQIAPKKEEKIISAPQKMMPKTVNF
jgi:asparagine synthetase B (glutamine-hydrolysing)